MLTINELNAISKRLEQINLEVIGLDERDATDAATLAALEQEIDELVSKIATSD